MASQSATQSIGWMCHDPSVSGSMLVGSSALRFAWQIIRYSPRILIIANIILGSLRTNMGS
ncbi:hypothetical protein SAMN04488498_13119 [Mesorhizobium albiziae]|uniref:Uncharacterized protein n=1 Tax=Neomesorhizobium albiziae TaxID=335020 RepID=A0A1I4EXD8_9HYPH|nr:hypothetical protein SAMN04488498_13119 [Mesorhizobium albiziae]